MTNAELLAKIKAEIERLYGKYETKYHETRLPYVEGLLDGFDLIEQFLDTLEKPVSEELEDEIVKFCDDFAFPLYGLDDEFGRELINKIARHFAEWGYLRAAEKYDEIEYNRQRAEESGSSEIPNDLEEAAGEYSTNEADRVWGKPDPHDYTDHSGCGAAHDNYEVGLQVGFKAGAKWQKEHSFTHHETNESLEEAVTHQMEDDGDVDDFIRKGLDKTVLKYAQIGAEWQKQHDAELIEIAYNDGITIGMTKQKEQMLKEAVEGEVVKKSIIIEGKEYSDWLGLGHSVWDKIVDLNWYNSPYKGDKVRIIIVKEDEK